MPPPLHIHVLGELEMRRDSGLIALPPSRKTRALLAYLALTGRPHRREQLCELFWDVAEDPRAELRWSLSKLRGVVDEDGIARIEAGRDEVAFRPHGAIIDALEVRRVLATPSLDAVPTMELERHARAFRGELLEGLELPDFDAYQAWCVAQREDARKQRVRLLDELAHRFADDPARATEYARERVAVEPHDTEARLALIRSLVALGRRDDARAQYKRGRRLAAESAGTSALSRLDEAWRALELGAESGSAPAREHSTEPAVAEPPAEPTLVGRSQELAALDVALARAQSVRRFATVTIAGALGVGKSRLLDAWLPCATRAGAAVATATAFEADAGRPYGPWLDAIERLPDAKLRPRPELAQVARASSDDTSPLDRERLFEGVSDAIASAAADRAIVIAIDDAHWSDPGSSALLLHVARRCDRLPVVLVLLARPGELDDNVELARTLRGLRHLGVLSERELPPLDAAATATLVRSVRAEADVDALYARSGGNPLFALELARAPADTVGATPSSVATAIRDRLAALPEEPAAVLRWGAVLRRGFTAHELESPTGLAPERVVDALDLLVRRALLARDVDDVRHVFAHELVRQVVYDGLSEPRRRLMHRRVAELLAARVEQGDDHVDVADVAHHAAAATDAALAVRTCLLAARRSLRMFARVDALALARRGLRHVEALADPERTRCSLELIEVTLAARRPDDSERVARQVETLAERALDLGALEHARLGYHLLAYVRWERGASLDAHRHMRHAQMISRGGSEPEQIVGMAEAARCLVLLERDLPEAQALALEAAARGRIAGIEPPATFAALGMLNTHRGRLTEAQVDLERALAITRVRRDRQDEYQALEQLVGVELARGDLDAAGARAAELAVLGARFTDGSEAPFARGLVALVRCAKGEEAEAELDAALGALTAVDAKQRLSFLASRAAWHDLAIGATARAVDRARRALEAATALERATEIALARAVLARAGEGEVAAHLDDIVARWPLVAASIREQLLSLVGARIATPAELTDQEASP